MRVGMHREEFDMGIDDWRHGHCIMYRYGSIYELQVPLTHHEAHASIIDVRRFMQACFRHGMMIPQAHRNG